MLALSALINHGWAWEGRVKQAFEEAQRSGRPVMVLATRTSCSPCQSMKASLMQDPTLAQFRRNFIVVLLDLADSDFRWVAQKYPVPFDMVPMVYVMAPAGELLYARAGALDVSRLLALQDATLRITGTPLTEAEIADNEARLQLVREAAISSKLTQALRLVSPIIARRSSAASVVTATQYEQRIMKAISEWSAELSRRLTNGENVHQSAYLMARLYVATPATHEDLRAAILAELRQHESQPTTRTAVLQGKLLVRARLEEGRQLTAEAIRSLQKANDLDPDSPSGRYAARRANRIQQRSRQDLTQWPGARRLGSAGRRPVQDTRAVEFLANSGQTC